MTDFAPQPEPNFWTTPAGRALREELLAQEPPDPRRVIRLRSALAANYLGLSMKALWWYRRHGGGPKYYRLGPNAVAYSVPDLDAWLAAREITPNRPPRKRGRPPKAT